MFTAYRVNRNTGFACSIFLFYLHSDFSEYFFTSLPPGLSEILTFGNSDNDEHDESRVADSFCHFNVHLSQFSHFKELDKETKIIYSCYSLGIDWYNTV